VGEVEAVDASSGGTRLVVDDRGEEILIPLVADICPIIDVDAKRIVVDAPEGLFELNKRA
jgi:ribosomal 30S subunit maturation factor RimM